KDKNSGEKKERTEWHRVVVWGDGLCGIVEQYLKKGSKVYLEGQLETRKWTDKEGHDKYTTEVVIRGFGGKMVMLDGKQDSQGGSDYPAPDDKPQGAPAGADLDDEIPF
ncbi:MAG: single-stranded DNA-binding protein, partial [Deltaproteobacteria bacterium]|nr:single-stranded DNA-binding protein [Deltaproteobacteria bacterium]